MTKILLILFILLSGCGEVSKAKANSIRQQEHRTNDIHDAMMKEEEALRPTVIAIKETLLWTGTIAGQVLIMVLAVSGGFYIIAFTIAKAKQANLMLIPLDKATHQYPLVIAGGKKAYNPNTLAVSDAWIDKLPYPEALRGSQGVQMIGAGEPRYKSYEEYEGKLLPG